MRPLAMALAIIVAPLIVSCSPHQADFVVPALHDVSDVSRTSAFGGRILQDADFMRRSLAPDEAKMFVEPALASSRIVRTVQALRLERGQTGDYRTTAIVAFDSESGEVFANSVSLQRAGRYVRGVRRRVDGVELVTAEHSPKENPGTGPYRRIESLPKLPFQPTTATYEFAYVTPTCDGNYVPGDAAHIYMGGWSGADSTPAGQGLVYTNVDAGLQFDKQPGHASTWELLFNVTGAPNNGYGFGAYGYIDQAGYIHPIPKIEFNCGNYTLRMSFSVQDMSAVYPGQMAMIVTANDGKNAVNFIWQAPTGTGGWTPGCDGCVLKRTTSIATPKDQEATAIHNGDHLTVFWSGARISCGFSTVQYGVCPGAPVDTDWTLQQTRTCSEYPNWSSFDGALRDCANSPSQPVAVQVTNFSSNTETDTITNLAAPTPAPTSGPPRCAGCGGKRQPLTPGTL